MANSKIGKAAEADVIIGIGKENTETQDDNFLRYLHVSKNKLGGSHGRATVRIEPKISRYIDWYVIFFLTNHKIHDTRIGYPLERTITYIYK